MAVMIILISLCVHVIAIFRFISWNIQGSKPGGGKKFVSSPKLQDWFWKPSNLLLTGYRISFPRVKWPGCRVKNSPLGSTEFKNEWSYTSTPPICLHGVDTENVTLV
jgi:hypothetical protein